MEFERVLAPVLALVRVRVRVKVRVRVRVRVRGSSACWLRCSPWPDLTLSRSRALTLTSCSP